MSDKKEGQPTINTGSTKSTTPVAGWRRWHFKSRIFLMLLGVVAIIIYLVCNGLAKQYAGLGAALCVIACFGFLVWHTIHLFAEQDAFDEQQLNQADKENNPTAPPPPH